MSVHELSGKVCRIGMGDVFTTSPSQDLFDRDFFAVVIAARPDASTVALRLTEPFGVGATALSHAVVSPRHEGRSMNELLEGKSMLCAVTLVSDERFSEKHPFDLSWWRGGNAAIATVSLV